jgi:hypothetical protein
MAPQELQLPGTRPTERMRTVDSRSIRTPSAEVPADKERLEKLEERYRHELMDDEERCELRDRILRLHRGVSR